MLRPYGAEVALINHVWSVWVTLSMYDVYNSLIELLLPLVTLHTNYLCAEMHRLKLLQQPCSNCRPQIFHINGLEKIPNSSAGETSFRDSSAQGN